MFLITLLSAFFSFPSFGQPVPQEVQDEVAYQACFGTENPQACIDNL